jgi:hypothetical protein
MRLLIFIVGFVFLFGASSSSTAAAGECGPRFVLSHQWNIFSTNRFQAANDPLSQMFFEINHRIRSIEQGNANPTNKLDYAVALLNWRRSSFRFRMPNLTGGSKEVIEFDATPFTSRDPLIEMARKLDRLYQAHLWFDYSIIDSPKTVGVISPLDNPVIQISAMDFLNGSVGPSLIHALQIVDVNYHMRLDHYYGIAHASITGGLADVTFENSPEPKRVHYSHKRRKSFAGLLGYPAEMEWFAENLKKFPYGGLTEEMKYVAHDALTFVDHRRKLIERWKATEPENKIRPIIVPGSNGDLHLIEGKSPNQTLRFEFPATNGVSFAKHLTHLEKALASLESEMVDVIVAIDDYVGDRNKEKELIRALFKPMRILRRVVVEP